VLAFRAAFEDANLGQYQSVAKARESLCEQSFESYYREDLRYRKHCNNNLSPERLVKFQNLKISILLFGSFFVGYLAPFHSEG
jgi:hypothetical protein